MKRMSCLESPLKVIQSASDLDQILLRRGRTDLTLWRPILLKLNFCHGLVDHSNLYVTTHQPCHFSTKNSNRSGKHDATSKPMLAVLYISCSFKCNCMKSMIEVSTILHNKSSLINFH